MLNLENFLNLKPLYYDEIDYTRMPKAWESIKRNFKLPKIIHVVGTNGKGSTGRFIAHYFYKSGYRVAHYSSPHILKLNERFWYNGKNVSDLELNEAHQKLLSILDKKFQDTLSYFEYLTLLAITLFQDCDFLILEAGLGGDKDATNVFDKELSIVCKIDYDHQDFLGDSIEQIAKEKLKSIQKFAILGEQKYKLIYKLAMKFSKERRLEIFKSSHFFIPPEIKEIESFIKNSNYPSFFTQNLTLAISALKFFGLDIDLDKFSDLKIFGRCQKIASNITIDVGHNELAASVLKKEFENKKIVLIYNSFKDKDYKKILKILKPIIKRIEFLPILNKRVEDKKLLEDVAKEYLIEYKDFENINEHEEYLVFGSFAVVESFLKLKGY